MLQSASGRGRAWKTALRAVSHVVQDGAKCRVCDKRPAGSGRAGTALRGAGAWHERCFGVYVMIISRTSQYAIQALIYLATQPRGRPVLNREIADELGVPTAYLAKILQGLSRGHILDSTRGRHGGFILRSEAGQTNLLDIVVLLEGVRVRRECLLGLKDCGDETACPVHRKWKRVKHEMLACLGGLTLDHLAEAVQRGQYRLSDLPQALPRH